MKCPVCDTIHDDNLEKCPVCGWEDYDPMDKAAMENRLKEIEEAKKRFFVSASLQLVASSNREQDGQIISQNLLVALGNTDDLRPRMTEWSKVSFARLSEETLNLRIRFTFDNGTEKERIIAVPNPHLADFWKVGVCCVSKGSYAICVGSEDAYTSSEPFRLLGDA